MFYRAIFHQKQFRYLGAFYLHSLVKLFAVSIFQIFSSIYVYQTLTNMGIGNSQALGTTSLFFSLIFLVQALCVAPALWLISKKGLKFCVFWGNITLVGFFALLYLAKFDPIFFIIAAVLGGVQIGLYWTAYHIYFAELTDDKRQGEELAIGNSLSVIASIGGPAFGGLIISYAGFGAVFLVMTVLMIIATLPLKHLPAQKDFISIDILKTIYALAPKEEQKSYLGLFGMSAIDATSMYFWPLFTFPILAGFLGVGFMGSLIALISSITSIIIGFLIDKFGPNMLLKILSTLDCLTWIIRIFANTPLRVFSVSGVSAFTTLGQSITLDSEVYERARHEGLVAFILQREIGLAVGKFILLLSFGIMFWFGLPLFYVFIFTGGAALLTRFYPKPKGYSLPL